MSLDTFRGGKGYGYIGGGKSRMIDGSPEVEAYWSTVQGATYLVHFDPATGRTAIKRDGSKSALTCQWKPVETVTEPSVSDEELEMVMGDDDVT